ncbi:MAG: OmpH family outer membrane protein [Verrucomicrobiia bacterium]|jgi:Skp family chaperone for outer membrane proteins
MKSIKFYTSLLTILAVASFGSASAKAELVILTISVNKAAEQFYKVQDFLKELQSSQEQAQERVQAINDEGKSLEQEYTELAEQANSDILTEEARNEAKQDAGIKYQEIAQKQNELRQFAENVQRQMAQRQGTQMSLFTKEIMEVVTEVSKERDASLVLDTSGASQNGMPAVISFDTSIDITDEVVTRINADKPAVEAPAAE